MPNMLETLLSSNGRFNSGIGPLLTGFLAWYKDLPIWSIVLICPAVLFIIYYIYVRRYITKMATLGTDEFHVEDFEGNPPRGI
jgi:hypothetical protein